jgi:diguanylate cyclase (GGDEF)-like protein/PAS domain S-box-containing protein
MLSSMCLRGILNHPYRSLSSYVDVKPFRNQSNLDWLVITCFALKDWLTPHPLTDGKDMTGYVVALNQLNQHLDKQVKYQAQALSVSQKALKSSEERWQLALKGTNDGLWDWHIETNEMFLSDRWQEIGGYLPGELAHHIEEWKQRIHPEDFSRVMETLETHLKGQTQYYVVEHRTRCKDGSYKWVLDRGQALWNQEGSPVRMVGSRSDISERKAMEARLIYQAEHDSLTGLLNRSALIDRLQQHLQHPHPSYTLLFIDIDRFKAVNDSLGHGVGDQLVKEVANSLSQLVRANDVVARLSGDEFVILLHPRLEEADVEKLINRMRIAVQQVASRVNLRTSISLSVGVTSSWHSATTPEDVLGDADIAMYAAKRAGGDRHVFFNPALRESSVKVLMLEFALKKALAHQQFVLHYQPIVNLHTFALEGFEALVRWQHPQRGLVMPGEFISLAETTGQILPLGQWILEEAYRQLVAWTQQFPTSTIALNVNVSVQQFYQPDFLQKVDTLIESSQIRPECLRLEMTESCFMQNVEMALETMNALNNRKVRLCIDDFGTGYSSLSYLHLLPVESLKIDKSFVNRLGNSASGMAMVKAILAMGQNLNIQVIAEGLETEAQLHKLRQLGCTLGQGYYFAKPGPAEAMGSWFTPLPPKGHLNALRFTGVSSLRQVL